MSAVAQQTSNGKDIAKALLKLFGAKGEHWTKGAYARDSTGEGTDPWDAKATSFCMLGACNHLGMSVLPLYSALNIESIAYFNDHNEWLTIKEALTKASQ